MLAVASFNDSSAQVFKPAWCSNSSKLTDSLVNIYFYFSLLETVLGEYLAFLFFSPLMLFWPFIMLKL